MSRRTGMVCAAALLLAAVGCSAGSLLLSWVGSGGKQQVVSGSVDDVSANLRAALSKIDIIVAVYPQADGVIKLRGQTKGGQRFTLLLKSQKTSHGESTAVSIEWEADADEQFWTTVIGLLVQPQPIGS
jgi:hypothetical protein